MGFSAKVLTDSVNGLGNRITTVELTYPRCIHAEFMTHRMFSRNSASSRAIPVEKMLQRVSDEPFIPIHWGKNQKGMQAELELDDLEKITCKRLWLEARDEAMRKVDTILALGLHKQIANRLLEPWMWITVIATGNEIAYRNFFKLRCDEAAEPHIQRVAYMLKDAYEASSPNELSGRRFKLHLPLTGFDGDQELSDSDLKKVSTARCARVSYLTHMGTRDTDADIELHDRLAESGHWSPFEHVATVCYSDESLGGNLGVGWRQYRKEFANEIIIL